jgi:PKD repeat protein
LIANGYPVAVIGYHGSDPYNNTYSTARRSYYAITGNPTVLFDGGNAVIGGTPSGSMYSSYIGPTTTAAGIPCSFQVDIYGENSGLNYTVVLDLEMVDTYSGGNLVCHLVLTESNIPYTWYTLSTVDHTCRLMVPDANGTAVDFSTNPQIQLTLQFSLDPSWTASNCEVIAFIQDNVTKDILQGDYVELDNLQPMQATAYFAANDTITCEGSSVQFTDNSLGNVVGWEWTFEGGNPGTSTQQNPTVTYDNNGEYDVTLVVNDGTVWDTLTQYDMILVEAVPATPSTPAGPDETCEGGDYEYTTDPVTYASSYTWIVEPNDAGSMSGTGTTATFEAANNWTGSYTIKVRAVNDCGNSSYSTGFSGTLYETPTAYFLEGGGGYCEGDPGAELTLANSETGVDYELYFEGTPTGNIVAGTGASISFGYVTDEGLYTAMGYTSTCENQMMGQPWVYLLEDPLQAGLPDGPAEVCNDGGQTSYTTEGAANATTYNWYLTPPEAGTIEGNDEEGLVTWDPSYIGMAYISVEGENDCGIGPVSGELAVEAFAVPEPVVSGLELVCNDEEADYSTPDNSGSTYTWDVTGGNIIAGAGTHLITVQWGNPGTGYVSVTELNADNCQGTSAALEVTIDDCTGLEELSMGQVKVYPNPSSDNTNVELELDEQANVQVHLLNQLGQAVVRFAETRPQGLHIIPLQTANIPDGLYTLQVYIDGTMKAQRKFIKAK